MSIDLKQYKLGDIAISQTGPFGSQLHEEDYVAEGTPIVTVEHLGSIGFTHQNLPFVSESDTNRLKKYTLKEGDIVFSRVGSIDRSVYVKAEEDGWLFSGRCIRVRCNNSVNPRYLSFYFRLPSFKKMMLDLSVGATMPSLNTEIMDNLILYLPSKEHQDVVASLLDDIDSKISNNNAIAAELEGMAKDLYDYWFVQFDFPDENGKPYKSSGGKMVWNEKLKRKIPEGWYAALMKDFLVIGNGKDHKDLEPGIYPVYGSGGLMRYVNDFLFSGESVLLPRKGSLSNFMYVNEPFWTVDTMFYTKEKLKGAAKYIYYSMRYVDITRYDSGTGVPSMTSISYYAMPFVKPTNDIVKLFDEILSPWIAQIKHNEVQIKNLTKQRDKLLPMLMNGQVSVMPSEVNCDLSHD